MAAEAASSVWRRVLEPVCATVLAPLAAVLGVASELLLIQFWVCYKALLQLLAQTSKLLAQFYELISQLFAQVVQLLALAAKAVRDLLPFV